MLLDVSMFSSPSRRLNSDITTDEDDSFISTASSSKARSEPNNKKVAWRGRRAASNAFYLPVVNKRDLFSLSWNTDESQLNEFQKYTGSFRHSSTVRCAWFDALATSYISGRWFSEAAVCQAHCIAIVGKELMARGHLKIDWSLLDAVNEDIAREEHVYDEIEDSKSANYSLEDFLSRIDETVQTLMLSERYEAVGPLCRIAIPVYESMNDYKSLISLYAELQHACSRADEIKASEKRHLGSYFRVIFYGEQYFGNEHRTEWIYREQRLTSLAEACDRMIESVRAALGHDRVEILAERKLLDESRLRPSTAYVLMTHVEPCFADGGVISAGGGGSDVFDDNNAHYYKLHTNVRTFVYEDRWMDTVDTVSSAGGGDGAVVGEQARVGVKRVMLTTEHSFPNTRRRQRVVGRTEFVLTPLDVACDSILFKASQIRKILNAAGITRYAYDFDKSTLRRLDLKQLQLFLQGSVSPTVNVGVLAYAEAFTTIAQRTRYGSAGIGRLVDAFKVLMTELAGALRVNEVAVGAERAEYQLMLRNSFDGMLERLSSLFDSEKFVIAPKLSNGVGMDEEDGGVNFFGSNLINTTLGNGGGNGGRHLNATGTASPRILHTAEA